jgi:hypothetical protein
MHTIDAILVHKPYVGGGFKLITTRQNQTQQYPHSIHKNTHGHYSQQNSQDKNNFVNICCLFPLYTEVCDFTTKLERLVYWNKRSNFWPRIKQRMQF